MLLNFLDTHFKFLENNCYPIFVKSDVKYKHKTHGEVLYPGLVIRTDAHSTQEFQVALFEDNKDHICDFHDCSRNDVVKFEVAILGRLTFNSLAKRTINWFGQGQDRLFNMLHKKIDESINTR